MPLPPYALKVACRGAGIKAVHGGKTELETFGILNGRHASPPERGPAWAGQRQKCSGGPEIETGSTKNPRSLIYQAIK